jgi:hypothetical protein
MERENKMSDLWINKTEFALFPDDYVKPGFSIVDLLASDRECAVNGAKMLLKDTPEWKKYLAEYRKKLEEHGLHKAVVQLKMSRLSFSEAIPVHSTAFKAIHYTRGGVPRKLLYDAQEDIACELSVPKREVHVFKSCKGISAFIADAAQELSKDTLLYDAALRDALEEFEQRGYTFNLWNTPWRPVYLENGKRAEQVIPVEGVSLDKALSQEEGE